MPLSLFLVSVRKVDVSNLYNENNNVIASNLKSKSYSFFNASILCSGSTGSLYMYLLITVENTLQIISTMNKINENSHNFDF